MKIILALIGVAIAAYVALQIAYYTVEPSFRVTATRLPSGAYRFKISPNFVVRSVNSVSIVGPNGMVAERRNQPVRGNQELLVSTGLVPRDSVTVECQLQYDRIMPCGTTKSKSLVLN